jgi:uncharacterized membrane protein YphA (DoxX/SURF4 family)
MLCTAYLEGGIEKVLNFTGALTELQKFGLPRSPLLVLASISIELGGSTLVLTGRYRWVGAIGLAGFTLYASSLANRFWAAPADARLPMLHAFVEHIGLSGAFLLVAVMDLIKQYSITTVSLVQDPRCLAAGRRPTLLPKNSQTPIDCPVQRFGE